MEHGRILNKMLGDFCEVSGHKINARKINIFFSIGVEESMAYLINSTHGFQRVQNLGHYLGVPIFHNRVTNSTIHFVIEKVRRKL